MKKLSVLAAGAIAVAATSLTPAPAQAGVDPFVGEVMTVGFNFCPRGWATTTGQLLPVSSNSALFSLLGTTYGGDGRSTFGLPDLRGRSVVGFGNGPGLPAVAWGQRGGTTEFTLLTQNLPAHSHTTTLRATTTDATSANPRGNVLAVDVGGDKIYSSVGPNSDMSPSAIQAGITGNGIAVNKRSPYLGMYVCIATTGVYPSRS